jgi:hypothetical protein
LRIVIYARYSTDEQHFSSIEDQSAYCRQFLALLGITNTQTEEIFDSEMSGELVSRPGIDQVRDGIRARRWDLLIVEDSSRLFRHETACGELIETAVDCGLRVLCLNDDVDTAEEEACCAPVTGGGPAGRPASMSRSRDPSLTRSTPSGPPSFTRPTSAWPAKSPSG